MRILAGLFALSMVLLCVSGSAYAAGVLKSYTVADGLAGGNIRAMIEDKRGDLWIATDGDGVSRYDGEGFRNFTTANGLTNNYVRAILEDRKGDLWFATGIGVCKYDGENFGTPLDVEAGLVNNSATSIVEDREGNLWFGTKGGVSKYDGEILRNFTTEDGLVDNWVWSILEDRKGNLWFGTKESGVSRYDGKKFTNFTTRDGLANNWVRSILEDSAGNLWFGTNKGVSRYTGKGFESFAIGNGLAYARIKALLEDNEGNLWFGTNRGVCKYDGRDFQTLTSKDGLVSDHVSASCMDREGNLWFGTWGSGISKYDRRIRHYLKDQTIDYELEDSSGNLWFVAAEGGIFRYDGDTFQDFASEIDLAGVEVPAILSDRNGDLWFTGRGGMTRYNGVEFQTIEDAGLRGLLAEPIFEDSRGNLWLTIWNNRTTIKIARYDGERFQYFPVEGEIYPSGVEDKRALEDKKGNIWFVTRENGIYRYDGRSLVHFTTEDGLAGSSISSMAEDTKGNLWFGIRQNDGPDAKGIGGLSMYTGEFSAEQEYQADLNRGNIPKGLAEAFKNHGFLLSQDAGVVVKKAGQRWLIRDLLFSVEVRFGDDLDSGNIPEDLEQAFAANGNDLSPSIMVSPGAEAERQWLITDRGNKEAYTVWERGDKLNVYDNKQTYVIRKDDDKLNITRFGISRFVIYSTKEGLSSDSVTGISEDGDGNLWFRTYHGGVTKYDGKGFKKFTVEDGLAGNTIRSMLKDKEGNLWFGSQGAGVSKYDGENFQTLTTEDGLISDTVYVVLADSRGNIWFRYDVSGLTKYTPCKDISPRVEITQVVADKVYPIDREVRVPPNTRVVFYYKGLTLNQFDNVLYKYRLEGYDETTYPTKKREQEYENLRPGTYKFHVTAIDRDLNGSEPQSQKLTVRRPRYREPKFIILSAVAAFALGLFIFEFFSHRRTAAQLKEEIRQRDKLERQRMTKELQEAHEVQMGLMSEPPPTLAEFDVFGKCEPAREVGGDFFRCIWLGQERERLAIALSDVCGKGMKAAITAMMAYGMLYTVAKFWWFSTGEILSELNRGLHERKTDEITYVVLSFASIDTERKTMQFSNAGLPWPLIKRGGDLITIEESSGFPLGMMPSSVYEETNVELKEGDIVVFYTDGITEAMNQRDEMYGVKRLKNMLRKADPGLNAKQLVDEILKDVDAFTGGAAQYDDMTVVVLRVKGKGGGDIND